MSYNPLNPNGQANMANSEPVVIASDQSTIPVSASSLPLPTGASTAANQATIIGHVDGIEGLLTTIDTDTGGIATSTASIDTKTPVLGQALAADSLPVVLTAAQVTTLTPPAAITGFATSAAQTDKSQFTKITDGTDTTLVTAAGELNVIATAQPGVDIGDVTINNASGGSAVNIQDGGNTITVDDGGGSITVDGALNTTFPSGSTDIFGMLKMSQQNNQIDIQFYRDTPQNLITVTTSNSGTATSSIGGALFSSGTNTNGGVKGVTYTNVTYRGGSEIYAYFTAAFTPTGLANTYIRMGLYDTNNGAFVGFEGTSFYASYRNNGVDTQTVSGSFNGDTLTGAGGSSFTRNGAAESVDFTKLNVYRIRFGWVGGAPIKYEILSPDGEWVTFHTLKFPNSSSGPSLRSADLPFTIDVQKTGAVGTNVQVITGCWACGNTYHPSDQFVIGQGSQTALNQNVILDVAGTASFDCYQFNSVSLEIVPASGTVTAGAITFQGSNDNTNFVAMTLYDDATPTSNPVSTYSLAASTPRYFSGSIHYRYFRARITTGVTGTTTGVQCHSAFRIQNYTPQIGIVQESGGVLTSLQIMDDWDNGASDGASVSGDIAHDAVDAGEPIKIGGKAITSETAAVAAADRVNAVFDVTGKQIVLPYANPENFVSGAITTAMTGTTSTSLVAAPAAGLRNYITTIIASNSHATVGTDIVIQDGSGGTTLMTIPAAAVYGGAVITLPTPLRQPTTATAIFCANVTTGASTKVSAVGYKGA